MDSRATIHFRMHVSIFVCTGLGLRTCRNSPIRASAMPRHLFTSSISRIVAFAIAYLFSSPVKSKTPPRYLDSIHAIVGNTKKSASGCGNGKTRDHQREWSIGTAGAHSSRSTIGSSFEGITRLCFRNAWKILASAYCTCSLACIRSRLLRECMQYANDC